MNKIGLILLLQLFFIGSATAKECPKNTSTSPNKIILKEMSDSNKIYLISNDYYIFLATTEVFHFLESRKKPYDQKFISLLRNESRKPALIDIYKIPLESRADEFFYTQSFHIIDDLVNEMLKNGFVKPVRMFTNDFKDSEILSNKLEDETSGFTVFCTPSGETLFEYLNYMI